MHTVIKFVTNWLRSSDWKHHHHSCMAMAAEDPGGLVELHDGDHEWPFIGKDTLARACECNTDSEIPDAAAGQKEDSILLLEPEGEDAELMDDDEFCDAEVCEGDYEMLGGGDVVCHSNNFAIADDRILQDKVEASTVDSGIRAEQAEEIFNKSSPIKNPQDIKHPLRPVISLDDIVIPTCKIDWDPLALTTMVPEKDTMSVSSAFFHNAGSSMATKASGVCLAKHHIQTPMLRAKSRDVPVKPLEITDRDCASMLALEVPDKAIDQSGDTKCCEGSYILRFAKKAWTALSKCGVLIWSGLCKTVQVCYYFTKTEFFWDLIETASVIAGKTVKWILIGGACIVMTICGSLYAIYPIYSDDSGSGQHSRTTQLKEGPTYTQPSKPSASKCAQPDTCLSQSFAQTVATSVMQGYRFMGSENWWSRVDGWIRSSVHYSKAAYLWTCNAMENVLIRK